MFYSILGKEKCEDSEKISIFTDFNLNVKTKRALFDGSLMTLIITDILVVVL